MASAVTVLGAGSWGTALAVHLGRVGHDVTLWARDANLVDTLARARENPLYLPGVTLPPNVRSVRRLEEACAAPEMVVFVCPSGGVRTLADAVDRKSVV